jgi:hypothetical protein
MQIFKISLTGITLFLATTPVPAFAQNFECRPSITESISKEFDETLAEMKVIFHQKDQSQANLSLALNDEVMVDGALCTTSEKLTDSTNKVYFNCSDENSDQMEILVDYENKKITLYSLYFPPEGKIETQCQELK